MLNEVLRENIEKVLSDLIRVDIINEQIVVMLPLHNLLNNFTLLRDHEDLAFSQLMDVAGVDYLSYGDSEWNTQTASKEGFSRAADKSSKTSSFEKIDELIPERFAVAYQLLSIKHNCRVRVKVFLSENDLRIPSVTSIWSVANWFEREAFDLFGIMFTNHPDLRRILTDYGFIGHPFRKDFPLIGNVEVRYDATEQRVIYEPVSIVDRTLVPKVIRKTREVDEQQ